MVTLQVPSYGASTGSAWLPLKRSEIEQLSVAAVDGESFTVQTLDPQAAKLTDVLALDNSIWIRSNRTLFIAMAGKGEDVHSVRVTVPVVNYSRQQADRVFAFLSALFKAVHPGWADAEKWPTDSLRDAWNKSPLVTNVAPADPNDVIVRRSSDGITSATFGVPPDIVVYTISAREQCVPDANRGNPFQRLVC
jgi:hypothetical protein